MLACHSKVVATTYDNVLYLMLTVRKLTARHCIGKHPAWAADSVVGFRASVPVALLAVDQRVAGGWL